MDIHRPKYKHLLSPSLKQLETPMCCASFCCITLCRLITGQSLKDGGTAYEKMYELGSGTNGIVYLVKRNTDGRLFALKETSVCCDDEVSLMNDIHNNTQLEGRDNVVKCVEQLHGNAFVVEYTGNYPFHATVDLFSYTLHKKGIQGGEMKALADGLINGVRAMHDGNVIHMDIKPENIMVSLIQGVEAQEQLSIGKVTIIDLGLAIKRGAKVKTAGGTKRYAAPELLVAPSTCKASPAHDLWSLGVTFMVANKCEFPFRVAQEGACDRFHTMFVRVSYKHRFETFSPEIVPYLRSMMRLDARKRTLPFVAMSQMA